MRPQATGIRKASTFTGQSIDMSIDTNAMSHIMSVLTNLYSDPEIAVLREYSCNARDSHTAIGSTAPIEVTLPTRFDQNLVIQDFGLGLSIDDITEIYSRYGASTKRDTDEQTGMLGLGSKSALTYATQFTMTSVKDGVKAEVLISVKVDGAGTMQVMDTLATDEPNGVRITIPTRPDNDFANKAKELFRYWPEGSVLVNGKAPARIEGRDLTDSIKVLESTGYYAYNESVVVMGGVPYPLPAKWGHTLAKAFRNPAVFYVPMGAVDFVPSREQMNLTPRTEAALDALVTEASNAILAEAQAAFSGCSGFPEALQLAVRYRNDTSVEELLGQKFSYKGVEIPSGSIKSETAFREWRSAHYGSRKTMRLASTWIADLVNDEPVMITNYLTEGNPSAHTRARVEKWCADNGHAIPDRMIFVYKDHIGQWSDMPRVDYATIKAIKVPRTAVASLTNNKIRVEDWDVTDVRGDLTETDGHKITGDVLYLSPVEVRDSNWNVTRRDTYSEIVTTFPNATIIVAGTNRHGRLTREFPQARTVAAAVAEKLAADVAALSPLTLALAAWEGGSGFHRNKWDKILQAGTINDPDAVTELQELETAAIAVRSLLDVARAWANKLETVSGHVTIPTSDYELAIKNYPLLTVSGVDSQPADVVQYMNMKHSTKGK